VFKVKVEADASCNKNGGGSPVESLKVYVLTMSLKKRFYLGWDGRTPIAARSFADLSSASGLVELGLEEADGRFEVRMERWEKSATRYSRGIRQRLTEEKAEELVRMDRRMTGRGAVDEEKWSEAYKR